MGVQKLKGGAGIGKGQQVGVQELEKGDRFGCMNLKRATDLGAGIERGQQI